MKKVMLPMKKDALPPLVMATNSQSTQVLSNGIAPFILKPGDQEGNAVGSPTKPSTMRLVQTPNGKKILLTNVVNTSKATSNSHVLLVSNTLSPTASNVLYSQSNPVLPSNKYQTVFLKSSALNCSTGEKPVMLQIPGFSQPLILKQNTLAVMNGDTSDLKVKGDINDKDTSAPAVIPVPLLSKPIISTSNLGMYINNGLSRFKVVGKPVPVTLSNSPVKIAPKRMKVYVPGRKYSSLQVESPLKNVETLQSPKLEESPSRNLESLPSPQLEKSSSMTVTSLSPQSRIPLKPMGSATPPAYLNIQIKEEPDETDTKIKVEVDGPMSILDVRIKEEPSDDQNTLLANDEQLRDVLDVATQDMKVNPKPRFYIRTTEGKLISITPEEAEAIGLNYKDKVEHNQKRLVEALQGFEETEKQRSLSQGLAARVLIPTDVNVEEFVSRHVPEEARKAAALMKNIGKGSGALSQKEKDNPVIIGEFTENDQRFLKIRIEPEEFESDTCNIPISLFNTYQCPYCKKDFKTKDHVISHIRIHTGERPYPCDVCGKRYRQRIDIIRHMRIHTGEKPFTCGLCNASFNQKSNLRSHMRIHTGERPVQCKVCGKGFSRNTHLKQHLKLHTGEKPFKCTVCDRPFRFKSGLQAHERIHSGLKPYACSLCGRSFTQIVGLIRHERTHSGEKPFRCQNCGKSFNNRESLQAHCKKHTDIRPHLCETCNKTFTDPAALRCHVKKYHTSTLICVICHREDFKTRIDLREHLRGHERDNWQETPDGDLIPSLQPKSSDYVSVDDLAENGDDSLAEDDEEDGSEFEKRGSEFINTISDEYPEEIQVEVELDPDDPMEGEDDFDDESEYEEHELHIESDDPLA